MTFLLLHLIVYATAGGSFAQMARKYVAHRQRSTRRALLLRITKLEHDLGLGIDWALDRIGDFAPVLSRPNVPGYSTLHQYAFKCYGCGGKVVYADYNKTPLSGVRDRRHLLCNSCLPKEDAA